MIQCVLCCSLKNAHSKFARERYTGGRHFFSAWNIISHTHLKYLHHLDYLSFLKSLTSHERLSVQEMRARNRKETHACVGRVFRYTMWRLLTSRTRLCSWDCWRRRPGTAARCSVDQSPRPPPFPGLFECRQRTGHKRRGVNNGCRIITVFDDNQPSIGCPSCPYRRDLRGWLASSKCHAQMALGTRRCYQLFEFLTGRTAVFTYTWIYSTRI